ncbi:T-complex protein 11 [Stagonosporopsis vannaccii]|nr:T-complex protein 11 [Stagonosporopsis vannaccii]
MGTQTPKAAGSNPPPIRASDNAYAVRSVEKKRAASVSSPSWHRPLPSHETPAHAGHDKRCREQYPVQSAQSISSSSVYTPDAPEQLARLLITMIPGPEGQKLAEAFRDASDLPPITRQSLSELDIQNIITNIRLRHDVNFDRDLSFRPNLDGVKGQEKVKTAQVYWRALVGELELYNRLFRRNPLLMQTDTKELSTIVQHAERRIPKIFETIQDVLKSLVPDRDHSRVDEHLDVEMLMKQIERGICDLVGLSEWISCLLKEHCAPMRDQWVDKMVSYTRTGVMQSKPESIVKGLCELLGILESMKLDVANHQIRNLKTILIEDTVGFETHYHLEKLVHGRARVNVESAQSWYQSATQEFASLCTSPCNSPRLNLEIFVRGMTASLFGRDGRSGFPDTTYLDTERLQLIKAEIEDHVFFEVCLDMFATLLKQFGYQGSSLSTTRQQLIYSLIAIMGESSVGYGLRQWTSNSEALSLEILRQASNLAGKAIAYDHDTLSSANQLLRHLFFSTFTTQARSLEAAVLPTILATIDKHNSSSPLELFNNLVPNTATTSLPPMHDAHPTVTDTLSSPRILHPNVNKLSDIANRISHIIILHWRIWSKIAYVQEDATTPLSTPILAIQAKKTPVPSCLKTGEAPETYEETHVVYEEPSQ